MRPETEHMIQVLRSSVRALGYTNRAIETKLGVSGGYLTRVFNGTMELRFEHILDIAEAIGLKPVEIFQMAYPEPQSPPTESAQQLRAIFGPRPSPPSELQPPVPEAEKAATGDSPFSVVIESEMERLMKKVFVRFFGEFMNKDRTVEEEIESLSRRHRTSR